LEVRREKLRQLVATLGDPIRYSETFDVPPSELMRVVRANGLEGVVAKRLGSAYKPGDRSGNWVKVRANRAQAVRKSPTSNVAVLKALRDGPC